MTGSGSQVEKLSFKKLFENIRGKCARLSRPAMLDSLILLISWRCSFWDICGFPGGRCCRDSRPWPAAGTTPPPTTATACWPSSSTSSPTLPQQQHHAGHPLLHLHQLCHFQPRYLHVKFLVGKRSGSFY